MQAEVISFRATDGTKLNGLIYNYCDNKDKIIISTHGMGSNCFKDREKAIAQIIEGTNISLLAYNNRGTEVVARMKKLVNNEVVSYLAGCADEDVLEGYFDIKGAIEFAIKLGYKKIYLQGHSLGSTKTVYTYNKLKKENYESINLIRGVILLSLVDIPQGIIDVEQIEDSRIQFLIDYAKRKYQEGKGTDFMPDDAFVQPISVNEFIRLFIDNNETNFARYHDNSYDYKEINNIIVPIFMRWGNNGELISQDAKDLTEMLNRKIINTQKDIDFIDGANHSFKDYESVLAKQIVNFINKY